MRAPSRSNGDIAAEVVAVVAEQIEPVALTCVESHRGSTASSVGTRASLGSRRDRLMPSFTVSTCAPASSKARRHLYDGPRLRVRREKRRKRGCRRSCMPGSAGALGEEVDLSSRASGSRGLAGKRVQGQGGVLDRTVIGPSKTKGGSPAKAFGRMTTGIRP